MSSYKEIDIQPCYEIIITYFLPTEQGNLVEQVNFSSSPCNYCTDRRHRTRKRRENMILFREHRTLRDLSLRRWTIFDLKIVIYKENETRHWTNSDERQKFARYQRTGNRGGAHDDDATNTARTARVLYRNAQSGRWRASRSAADTNVLKCIAKRP